MSNGTFKGHRRPIKIILKPLITNIYDYYLKQHNENIFNFFPDIMALILTFCIPVYYQYIP